MNPSSHSDPTIDEPAANWAARLDGDALTADERTALDRWLAQSPAHRAALSDYCQLSADLEDQLPALVAAGTIRMPAARAEGRRQWTFPRIASLTLAAAAAITVITWIALPAPQIQNVATSVGQRQSHTLGDGTRVELNAHTSLRFENTKTERRVRLAGGEALFAVAKDTARPFIVETPNGAVRVTGTTFNVRNETTTPMLEVTVIEGSVQVRPSDPNATQSSGPVSLGAGDQLTAGAGDVSVRQVSRDALEDILAWRDGRIVFDDVPLHEAAARFARYHGRNVRVAPSVANEKVGGRYGIDDFSGFFAGLEIALPVTVHYELSGAVVVGPRNGG